MDDDLELSSEVNELPEVGFGGEALPPSRDVGRREAPGEQTVQVPQPQRQGPPRQTQPVADDDADYLKHRRGDETKEQTYRRLWAENRDRATKEYHDNKANRLEIQRLESMMTPLLQFQYQQLAREAAELDRQAAAAVPDPQADPAGFAAYMSALNYQQTQDFIQRQEMERLQLQQQTTEQQEWEARIAPIQQEVQALIASTDPASEPVKQDLALMLNLGMTSARQRWPDASQEEVTEFVRNEMYLTALNWLEQGYTVGQGAQAEVAMMRQAFGAPAPQRQGTSRTAESIRKESRRSQRAAAVSPMRPGTPSGQPGQDVDFSTLSEEDYVTMGMRGQIDTAAFTKRRFGRAEDRYQE